MKITREPELFGAGVVAESYDEEPTDRDVEGGDCQSRNTGRTGGPHPPAGVVVPHHRFPGITVSAAGPPYIDYCGVDGLRRTSGRLIAIGCRDHCRQSFGMGAGMMAA